MTIARAGISRSLARSEGIEIPDDRCSRAGLRERMYGRRPGCKWILTWLRSVRVQVMYPACEAALMAAGPDGFRRQVPISGSRSMAACVPTGFPVSGPHAESIASSMTVSHHVVITPATCWAAVSTAAPSSSSHRQAPFMPLSRRVPVADRFHPGSAPPRRCVPSCWRARRWRPSPAAGPAVE